MTSARKAQTVMLAVNPAELVDQIATEVARRLEVKSDKRRHANGEVEREGDSMDTFADRLDTSRWTVRRLIRQGKVKAVKLNDLLRIPNGAEQARQVLQECPEFKASAPRAQTTNVKRNRGGRFEAKARRPSATSATSGCGEIQESELETRTS